MSRNDALTAHHDAEDRARLAAEREAQSKRPADDHAGISTDGLRFEIRMLIDCALRQIEHARDRLSELAGRGTEAEGDAYAHLEGDASKAARVLSTVRRRCA